MQHKLYKNQENMDRNNAELTVDCEAIDAKKPSSNSWNPNVPFVGTQEQWWEHFHEIEKGKFMTIEEFDHRFEIWRRELLASKLK